MREKNKVVFLDRDGTINSDEHGYINHPDDLILYPFAAKAIGKLNKMGYLVFIVTNQAGVAYGYFQIDDVKKINEKLISELAKENTKVDDIIFAPYHKKGKVEPYNIQHEDRKPGIGMFKKIQEKYQIDNTTSYMIGDKFSDIGFGYNAGLKTILVLTGNGEDEFLNKRKNSKYTPDFIVNDLASAVDLIEKLESY